MNPMIKPILAVLFVFCACASEDGSGGGLRAEDPGLHLAPLDDAPVVNSIGCGAGDPIYSGYNPATGKQQQIKDGEWVPEPPEVVTPGRRAPPPTR